MRDLNGSQGYNRQLLIAPAEARVTVCKRRDLPVRQGPVLMVGRPPVRTNHEVTEFADCSAVFAGGVVTFSLVRNLTVAAVALFAVTATSSILWLMFSQTR